ncbi:hypothetical protein ROLI_029460 [Roseobacter fucihabitans]|uniref:SPOR domain-containing protein n=1 Tax=Roseobacter fucihabitans TaxID=1537242 RepID=A0ABZ2BVM5_9RHOB|nr:hypothetical protein [Roseobacter litoralis]MBC6965310.1 hypothetical protein [Roseobacter litoralis]
MSLYQRPELLLKYVVAYLAVFLIFLLTLTIVWSQGRYWGSAWLGQGDYAERQKAHHQFVCRPQVGPKSPNSGDSDQIRHRYFSLMEVTRQEVSPSDFVGKFQRFILCSNFSRVGVGSVQLAATGSGSFFLDEMHVEEAQIRQGEFAAILDRYPAVPGYLSDEIMCLLRHMAQDKSQLEQEMCSGAPEEDVETIDPPSTGPPSVPTATGSPGPWILVSGADQSDAGALHEVKAARNVLAGTEGFGSTEVFLIRSWRRTVTYFDSKPDAEQALNAKKSKLRYGGYIRNTTEWCDNIPTAPERTVDGVRFWRCSS